MSKAQACPSAPMIEMALVIVARVPGAKVFPVRSGAKFPPLIKDWPTDASSDPDKIQEWWTRWPSANIGLTGVVAIDIDVRDGKPGIASFKGLGLPGKLFAKVLWVRTPSGGHHLIFARPEGPSIPSRIDLRPGLDVKADGGYVLAAGSRIDGMKTGYWIKRQPKGNVGFCPSEIAAIIRDGAPAPKRPDRDIFAPGAVADDPAMIEQAANWLQIDAPPAIQGQCGDNTTYIVACGLRDLGLSEPMAFELLADHYNPRCAPPWDWEDLQAKVESAWRSAQNPAGAKHPGAIAKAAFEGVEIVEPELQEPVTMAFVGDARAKSALGLIWSGQPLGVGAPWLLHHKLPRVGVAMLVAPSQAGKTFLAIELARVLAMGEPFFGTRGREVCGTLLLAGEGFGAIRARISKLSALPFAVGALPTISGHTELEALAGVIERDVVESMRQDFGVRLGLIIVDTLAASGLLKEENNNSEAAAAVKALERMAQRLGCLVLFTHHPPKNSTGSRGASALFNGVDTVAEIEYDPARPLRIVRCTKGRDGPQGLWGCYQLETETVAIDEYGDPITTCRVIVGEYSDATKTTLAQALTPAQIAICQTAIAKGHFRKSDQCGDAWAGHAIASALEMEIVGTGQRATVRAMLGWLLDGGWLRVESERDQRQRRDVDFVRVGHLIGEAGSSIA